LSLSNSGAVKDNPGLGEREEPELEELFFDPKGHMAGIGLSFDGRFMSGISADSSKDFDSGYAPSDATENTGHARTAHEPKAGLR
jgi:hypothetical protein